MSCLKNGSGCGPQPVTGSRQDYSSFHQFLSRGNVSKRLNFFKCYREQIHAYLLAFIRSKSKTIYREFLLENTEGQSRVRYYLDTVEAALSGNVETFLEDQKRIGYVRAVQGYNLNDMYGFTVTFKDAFWQACREYNDARPNPDDRLSNDDIFTFNKLIDGSYYYLTLSFLDTRDEIIRRHQEQLQTLQRFSTEAVSVFEEEKIWARITQGVFDVFGLNGTFILPEGDSFKGKRGQTNRMIGLQMVQQDLEKILEGIYRSLKPMALDKRNTLCCLSSLMDTDQFRFVASPIMDRKSRLTGVICVHDQGRTFRFAEFNRNLLYQFSYFIAAVSANCRMVSEIAEKKEDLRNLTKRLISVQEEERKKIAADIHDVLTQALTGIGYKALYCMEIAGQDLDRLNQELELLTETVNDALGQSRQIISNLRPHILDDIGVIAAFRKLMGDFDRKFAIKTRFRYPDSLQIDPGKGIALFRILQEALHNARRHAAATEVTLSLSLAKDDCLIMTVKDNGRGFDPQKQNRQRYRPGLGLLTMRERAEDLGGEFSVDSGPGKGCRVIVKVPLKEAQDGR